MGDQRDWIIELNEELYNKAEISQDEPECWEKRSIYRIPAHVLKLNKKAYKPWVVSLGPYHHRDEHLKPMKEHKHRALRHFLHRSQKPLKGYVDALAEVVQDLMDAYDQLDIVWKQDAKGFLELMLVDGCFIVETMRAATQTMDYSRNDPIFGDHGKLNVVPYVRRDMLLLENQVPLLVLDRLLAVESGSIEQNESQLINLILKFFGQDVKEVMELVSKFYSQNRQTGKCQHILNVYRKSLIFTVPKDKSKKSLIFTIPKGKSKYKKKKPNIDEGPIHSATEMKEAGIKFEKSKSTSLKDISFKGHTLRLPKIPLDDVSESTFLNIVSFERLHVGAGNEITSYIFFMNRLVNNVRDVRLLKSDDIISHAMGCDEDVVKLFLTLSKEIILDPNNFLDEVYRKVSEKLGSHFNNKLNKWRYNLIHTYFRSPWAIVSVIAATLGFGLTTTQTLYTILSFLHRRHKY